MSLWLVIVTGAPGTGKTTFGRRLATDLRLPFVNKDSIKERLHDVLGTADIAASRRLGKASYGILFDFAETLLTARQSFVIESNFSPEFHNEKFTQLTEKYGCSLLQLYLYTDGQTLYQRVQERRERGERHPAHYDVFSAEEIAQRTIQSIAPALDIPGIRIDIDTTDFAGIEYAALLHQVRALGVVSPAGADEKHTHAK